MTTDGETATLETDRAAALADYLSGELDDTVTDVSMIADGLNLVVGVSTATEPDAYVLRKPNELRQTAMFVDVATEYTVLEALTQTAVPAPEPIHYCADDSVLGDPFVVATWLDGEVVPLGSQLPERYRTPTARRRVAYELVDTLAGLHTAPTELFETHCDTHSVREQVGADIARVERVAETVSADFTELLAVGDWLRENAPTGQEPTLVHGDYRPGNVLFADAPEATTTTGEQPLPTITGVLDWETPMIGDPLAELGYLCLRWRDDGDATPALDRLDADCDQATMRVWREDNERGLAPFTSEPGCPTRQELIARYEDRTGITVERSDYYLAHAAFVLAAVWTDLHRRSVEAGEESDYLPHVAYLRLVAESVIDGAFTV